MREGAGAVPPPRTRAATSGKGKDCEQPGSAAARRSAFVEAAAASFFHHGYAGTTMSSIAQSVGGSKTTLWTYFPSKEHLFSAVVDDIVDVYGTALLVDLSPEQPVVDVLRKFSAVLVETLLHPTTRALYRLVVGESGRFPHIAELFFERGPRRGRQRLTDFMAAKMDMGELRRADPSVASQQFIGLCQASIYEYSNLNLPFDAPGRARVHRDLTAVIDTFSRAWIPQSSEG